MTEAVRPRLKESCPMLEAAASLTCNDNGPARNHDGTTRTTPRGHRYRHHTAATEGADLHG
ncbi:hypothetical protein ABZ345_19870 [Lentzea sp. NPDC005914]|uniref:hypothetical protein n=1 Tax=Lentzea sp. NPDC005914 TaxID=3154572 RepID=UPI003409BA64